MSSSELPSDIEIEALQPTEQQAVASHRSGISLQARYEHHKARHKHYKKGYKHLRRYRWISLGLGIVSFSAVFSLMAVLPTYNEVKNDYDDSLAELKIVEDQNRQLKEALLIERRNNFDLNKENHPELRIFAFNTLIATDQSNIRSAFFEASDDMGKKMAISYQLLAEGPVELDLALALIDQTGQQVFQHPIDFGEVPPKQGESLTVESTINLDKNLDVRYFRIVELSEE
ncbi:hypothetical protein SNR37_000502 [Agarivorans aestuarii]|uniref:Uncharacterized protein n=1 Tax=Agarivorans aestuarii TaxID=1563703 RepID=A0ABU7G6Y9_9ALTE|nr:hypothetical protein [Agarivorans aestuarii]MEE1675177.1 hypothetical protein [Agarivorans aestuarii]